ncbi:hypothetical protein M514_06182 [Trichuris suis]|uniref:Tc1-like transposase DDE domain-containing protein n=1 Tax=Trichuris suis TaxID=68888 RepID=A0A085NFG2_9BILA|nr:hypothetical protein M513_06182 [Trichuris suis]KFD68208.1 hypothetical protein M514_06182 [Trichuris suis]
MLAAQSGQDQKELEKLDIKTLRDPPYSTDLSPTDYHFFRPPELYVREEVHHDESSLENGFCQFLNSCSANTIYWTIRLSLRKIIHAAV